MGDKPLSSSKVVTMKKPTAIFLMIIVFVLYGCEKFLTGENLDSNPNKVDDVDQISVESLFFGYQVTL